MCNTPISRPPVTGPGQISPQNLIAPVYRAAIDAANAQINKLGQLRDEGTISEAAHYIADSHLSVLVQILTAQLTTPGDLQPASCL